MAVDPLIGRKIGDFVIEARLGEGATATVYQAYQVSMARSVALKVIALRDTTEANEEFRQRFFNEAKALIALEHMHILPIYAYGVEDELAYIAMRWLKGGSLGDLIAHHRPYLPQERCAKLLEQIAEGLHYAHQKGIIHRDLKPSNILLDDLGNAYLSDFGLAKFIGGSSDLTRSGTVNGTPLYMSPEQVRGEKLDPRSDIYSLSVIAYYLFAGRLPFEARSGDVVSLIYQHLEKIPEALSEYNPTVNSELDAVILRGLNKERQKRPPSAKNLAHSISRAVLAHKTDGVLDATQPIDDLERLTTEDGHMHWAGELKKALLERVLNFTKSLTQRQSVTAPKNTRTLLGERKIMTDQEPSAAEIAIARNTVGKDGFVALISCAENTEYHAALAREMRDRSTRYKVPFRLYNPQGSQASEYERDQIVQIERARAEGASALIICPLNAVLLHDTLAAIEKAAMPLVLIGENMPSYGGVMIGGDNYAVGLEPGRFAGKLIRDELNGVARVVLLSYPEHPGLQERAQGFADGIGEFAPQAQIVSVQRGGRTEFAKASIQVLLHDQIPFDVIVSINDAGAIGAIEALEAAGVPYHQVHMISIDADSSALPYIKEGRYLRASLRTTRMDVAHGAVDAAVRLLAGTRLPEVLVTPAGTMITRESLASDSASTSS